MSPALITGSRRKRHRRITGTSLCTTSIWQEVMSISVILTAGSAIRRSTVFVDVREVEGKR
jgi:hypothetical protein